jgi:hypothetical protein
MQAEPLDEAVAWLRSRKQTWEDRIDRLETHLHRGGGAELTISVQFVDGDRGGPAKTDLLGDRSDLLVGEPLKLLGGLPNVGDEQPVVGRDDPVKQAAGRARAARREAHLLDEPVARVSRSFFSTATHRDLIAGGCSPTAPG